jgi:DivIVA domain-containing protein
MTRGSGEPPAGTPGAGAKITPLDIQQKEFRVSRFGGYRMRDVDEFLDKLTEVVSEMVEENARLRRQTGAAPVVGSPDLDDVARQADEIIQRARDEAARISEDARARSAATGSSFAGSEADRAAVRAFLEQEREFLQDLAGLVQGHAENVKEMAKNARRQEPAAAEETESLRTEDPGVSQALQETLEEAVEEAPAAEPAGVPDRTDRVVEIEDAATTQAMPKADEPGELTPTRPSGQDRKGEGDPSLRDLFWGEDD